MRGLGNDFVIIDQRKQDINLNKNLIQRIADRNKGVGFDQLALILSSDQADAELVFFNSDGSKSRTCGNATRCIAKHLMQEKKTNNLTLSTDGIILIAKNVGGNLTSVNMGVPKFEWNEIPISKKINTLKLPIEGHPTGTSIGNPHCTFFVEDFENIDLNKEKFLAKATNQKVKDRLKVLTENALEKGIFGAPTFLVNKKIFWGQDRLSYAVEEVKK